MKNTSRINWSFSVEQNSHLYLVTFQGQNSKCSKQSPSKQQKRIHPYQSGNQNFDSSKFQYKWGKCLWKYEVYVCVCFYFIIYRNLGLRKHQNLISEYTEKTTSLCSSSRFSVIDVARENCRYPSCSFSKYLLKHNHAILPRNHNLKR